MAVVLSSPSQGVCLSCQMAVAVDMLLCRNSSMGHRPPLPPPPLLLLCVAAAGAAPILLHMFLIVLCLLLCSAMPYKDYYFTRNFMFSILSPIGFFTWLA